MSDDAWTRLYNNWVHGPDSDGCKRCGLFMEANQVVFGDGLASSALLVLGEAPGEMEDLNGSPFLGKAGKFLREQAKLAGVDLGEVRSTGNQLEFLNTGVAYWTNVNGCRPPNNRKPTKQEIAACLPRVDGIVALLRPKAILALGTTAMFSLLGLEGITKRRGGWHESTHEWRGQSIQVPVMPTFHPSYFLRGNSNPVDLESFRADIRAAFDRAYPSM